MNQRIWLLTKFFIFHLVLFLLLRAGFFFYFQSTSSEYDSEQLQKAIYLGTKFDIRLALALLAPVYILGYLPFLNPIKSGRVFWPYLYSLLFIFLVIIYVVDFGYYDYLQTRVNGSILQFAANPDISLQMVWQTYPVIPVLGALLVLVFLYYKFLVNFIFFEFTFKNLSMRSQIFSNLLFFLLFAGGLYGKISTFPLRWSEAFFTQNNFISALALNPILYLAETHKYQKADFNIEEVKKFYPVVANYLGVPTTEQDEKKLNYTRNVLGKESPLKKPNVIIVVMESMAIHKTSLVDNPINTTPALKQIADEGYYFNEYYVPSEGTARSMFTLITGIPDVSTYKTASRNPLIVNQNVILDKYQDYKKFYFLGGNANWGQIRSVFSHNIEGVHIVEEGQYQKKAMDVWGISDLDLFKETHRILGELPSDQSFFAVVQAASFHRPYTIPEDRDDFKLESYPDELVRKASFLHNEEMNSLRFSDYSLGVFFDLFKKSKYYDNTILVVVGDHGLPDQNAPHIPFFRRKTSIEKFHVPLIIYNKKLFPEPKVDTRVAAQMDVMATIAGLIGIPYQNTTFGRDLFDKSYDYKRLSFTIDYYAQPHQYGVFDGEYYVLVRADKEELYHFSDQSEVVDVGSKYPEKLKELSSYARGFYETAKYMLYNNPKKK